VQTVLGRSVKGGRRDGRSLSVTVTGPLILSARAGYYGASAARGGKFPEQTERRLDPAYILQRCPKLAMLGVPGEVYENLWFDLRD
jgi:hypothetical protein